MIKGKEFIVERLQLELSKQKDFKLTIERNCHECQCNFKDEFDAIGSRIEWIEKLIKHAVAVEV